MQPGPIRTYFWKSNQKPDQFSSFTNKLFGSLIGTKYGTGWRREHLRQQLIIASKRSAVTCCMTGFERWALNVALQATPIDPLAETFKRSSSLHSRHDYQ